VIPTLCSDCHGFQNPCGFAGRVCRVRVRIGFCWPSLNPYPQLVMDEFGSVRFRIGFIWIPNQTHGSVLQFCWTPNLNHGSSSNLLHFLSFILGQNLGRNVRKHVYSISIQKHWICRRRGLSNADYYVLNKVSSEQNSTKDCICESIWT